MCGIAGYIGQSKNKELTYELASQLFDCIDSRGLDAAGWWGTQRLGNKVFYHKEPIPSSKLVQKKAWRDLSSFDCDMMLLHARATSPGVGHSKYNQNNHPFVTTDCRVGLIHNGKLPDKEYKALKQKYECRSDCDSEILLRMFEAAENYTKSEASVFEDSDRITAQRLLGVLDIWKHFDRGSMAVVIGEQLDHGHRRMWMFRNHQRELWLADLRESLGQLWFVSTPEIWEQAKNQSSLLRKNLPKARLLDFPTEEVWMFEISPEKPVVEDGEIVKYDVVPEGDYFDWKHDGKFVEIKERQSSAEIVSHLDKFEDVIRNRRNYDPEIDDNWEENESELCVNNIGTTIESIKDKLTDISVSVENKSFEGSIWLSDLHELLTSLSIIEYDVDVLQRTIEQ